MTETSMLTDGENVEVRRFCSRNRGTRIMGLLGLMMNLTACRVPTEWSMSPAESRQYKMD